MGRTILLSLLAILAAGAAQDVCAQRHGGGMRPGVARGGFRSSHARAASHYGYGYGYLPFDYDTDYADTPQPVFFNQPPPMPVQQPAPPVAAPVGNPVVTEYKWPEAGAANPAPSATSGMQPFAIVLKDGSTLSAVMVFASEDDLHYVDPDERHLRVPISEIDRAATLKLNRARNLNLHLPSAQ